MNYWTNIHIPQRFNETRRRDLEIAELHFKLKAKQEECNLLYKELENIFEALKKGEIVTMTYDKETFKAARIIEIK